MKLCQRAFFLASCTAPYSARHHQLHELVGQLAAYGSNKLCIPCGAATGRLPIAAQLHPHVTRCSWAITCAPIANHIISSLALEEADTTNDKRCSTFPRQFTPKVRTPVRKVPDHLRRFWICPQTFQPYCNLTLHLANNTHILRSGNKQSSASCASANSLISTRRALQRGGFLKLIQRVLSVLTLTTPACSLPPTWPSVPISYIFRIFSVLFSVLFAVHPGHSRPAPHFRHATW